MQSMKGSKVTGSIIFLSVFDPDKALELFLGMTFFFFIFMLCYVSECVRVYSVICIHYLLLH